MSDNMVLIKRELLEKIIEKMDILESHANWDTGISKEIKQAIADTPDAVIPVEKAHNPNHCYLGKVVSKGEMRCSISNKPCSKIVKLGACPQITKNGG